MKGAALLAAVLIAALVLVVADRHRGSIPIEVSAGVPNRSACLAVLGRSGSMSDRDERYLAACLMAGEVDDSDLERQLDRLRKR